MKRVLLVDDHPAMRFALSAAVGISGVGEVVGESDSAAEALELAARLKPDLAVVDLRLKGGDSGIELCRDLKALPNPLQVLVYTSYNSSADLALCHLSGADGYAHKSVDHSQLVEAIRKTAAGEEVRLTGVDTQQADTLLRVLSDKALLTAREKDILSLVLRRMSNDEIAKELHVSVTTIKTHVRSILRKLGFKNRWELLLGPYSQA